MLYFLRYSQSPLRVMMEEAEGHTLAWRKETMKEALAKLINNLPAFRELASRQGNQPGSSKEELLWECPGGASTCRLMSGSGWCAIVVIGRVRSWGAFDWGGGECPCGAVVVNAHVGQ